VDTSELAHKLLIPLPPLPDVHHLLEPRQSHALYFSGADLRPSELYNTVVMPDDRHAIAGDLGQFTGIPYGIWSSDPLAQTFHAS